MLSSKNESKQDARFAGKLDVLTERVDSLATTLATTASAMAKKDGEIAALRRDLEARDQTLNALVTHAREQQKAPAADAPMDVSDLRALRNAVASLTKEHADGAANGARVEQLVSSVHALSQRVDELASKTPEAPVGPDPATMERIDGLEQELASTRARVERLSAERDRSSEELLATLGALRTQVGALDGLRASGVTEEQVDGRIAETDAAIQSLTERLDTLAATVESAVSGLGEKESELAALQQHFSESSTRIESVVADIRETLHALPEPSTASLDDVAARLERVETATRKTTEVSGRTASELSDRIDTIDERVATVAQEVSRAKTLWPVALRSLEARLEDAVQMRAADDDDAPQPPADGEPTNDLLAGLRDSLTAMESVAAEMAKASEALAPDDEVADAEAEAEAEAESDADGATDVEASVEEPRELEEPPAAAAAAGASIVPLRATEP
jgi:DNA repair exonuclease SbcCD ATPase subunit